MLSEMNAQQLTAYLQRVALNAPPDPTLAGACALHRAHLLHIPFESLDIHLGVEITLDADRLRDKLVDRRRGGFCYEHNLLFAEALAAVGFHVDLLSARVAGSDGYGPPFDHMVLRAELDGREHLLDVGFGEGFRFPLPIDGEWHGQTPSAPYRVVAAGAELRVEHRDRDSLVADYLVDPTPREVGDFAEMCQYQQTSPDSGFTRRWTASIATLRGRVTVVPWQLIETIDGEKTSAKLTSRSQLAYLLRDRFGIEDLDLDPLGGPG